MNRPIPAIAGLGAGIVTESYLLGTTKETEDYWALFRNGKFSLEEQHKAGDDFKYLSNFFITISKEAPHLFDDCDGNVRIPKWALKAVSEAFRNYDTQRNKEHSLEMTLDVAFKVPTETKKELNKRLLNTSRKRFFNQVNMIRMVFQLNVQDAAIAAWKIIEWQRAKNPKLFLNFNANQKSMLDIYHRTYPMPKFLEWVNNNSVIFFEDSTQEEYRVTFLESLEKRVPEAAAFIRRKLKNKQA